MAKEIPSSTLEWFVDRKYISPVDFDTTTLEALQKNYKEGNQSEKTILRSFAENKSFSEFIVASSKQPLEEIQHTKDGYFFFLIRTQDWQILPPCKGSRDKWRALFSNDAISLEVLCFCNGKSLLETYREQVELESKSKTTTFDSSVEESLYNFFSSIFPVNLARQYSVRLFDAGINLISLLDTPIPRLTELKIPLENQAVMFQALGKRLGESRARYFTNIRKITISRSTNDFESITNVSPRKRVRKEKVLEVDNKESEEDDESGFSSDSRKSNETSNDVQQEKTEKEDISNMEEVLVSSTALQNQSESEDTVGEDKEIQTIDVQDKKLRWVGKRVKVYWHVEESFFKGTVLNFNEKGKAVIQYDDGDVFSENEEDLNLINPQVEKKLKLARKMKSKKPKRFPDSALHILKSYWKKMKGNPYPTKEQKEKISLESGLSLHQIDVWFKNARVRGVPK